MDLDRLVRSPDASAPGDAVGPVGNARLTGTTGAALVVVLAVEGVTLLQIHQLISWHVFVGMLVVSLVVLKTGSTGYRFTRYYTGSPPYRTKGPPSPLLRVTAPLLVASTFALLGTGLALLALGRSVGRQYLWTHKVSFFVWAAVLAVHVLAHLRETTELAVADWRERPGRGAARLPGAPGRLVLLVAAVAVGVVLGVVALGWVGTWHHFVHGHG